MHWVREYPATLIPQPEAIWSHPLTEVQVRNDGTAWRVLPLWTMDEAPSDLSAELEIDEQGRVTIIDHWHDRADRGMRECRSRGCGQVAGPAMKP